ncbi:uncharacterized protein LOC143856545 [Tasmannia lanceolata]|uniref:uncharacterized protein LOC143856545 n=1 Tax=Tasmannia lanceolata TaxID=3420 RepID=UPI004062FD1C
MASFNPLARILEDNKLSGPNYVDWKRNLTIVLRAAKVYYVLTTVAPKVPDNNATNEEKGKYNKWLEDDDMAKCYILASMTNVLQHQHQGLPTATDMMANIKEMFGEQNRTARFITMKSLVSTKMVEGTPVREHMLKMMGFLNELDVLGAFFDAESQIDIILASLPQPFDTFVLNYNMNKLEVTLSELLNMLQSAEDLLKRNLKSAFVVEGNVPKAPKSKEQGWL